MNEIEICLQNQVANSNGKLKPSILRAISNLYQQGFRLLTAKMVKNECFIINQNVTWNEKIPAICNAMRTTSLCWAVIVGENVDNNGFTISFNGNVKNADVVKKSKKNQKKITKVKEDSKIQSKNNIKDIDQEKLFLSKNFKVVIICAGEKQPLSGLTYNGQPVNFRAISNRNNNEYLPDDLIGGKEKITWRNYVITNQNQEIIPFKAYQLYSRSEYRCLYEVFNNSLYILSAGWGLVRADYRLPDYDITFSTAANAPNNTRRNVNNNYNDFDQLQVNSDDDIIFVGGRDYLNLFYTLTQNLTNRKIIYYNSKNQPDPHEGNYVYRRYYVGYYTNWHYQLAKDLCNGLTP